MTGQEALPIEVAEAPPRGHLLHVTESKHHTTEDPDYDVSIECLSPARCDGWQECDQPHEHDGQDAADGPWECPTDAPWCDEDEFEFHGVLHTWRGGYGWTVPYPGCVVQDNDGAVDEARDIARDRGAGTYVLDDDWDEFTCYLAVIEPPAAVKPCPECAQGKHQNCTTQVLNSADELVACPCATINHGEA